MILSKIGVLSEEALTDDKDRSPHPDQMIKNERVLPLWRRPLFGLAAPKPQSAHGQNLTSDGASNFRRGLLANGVPDMFRSGS